MFIKLSLLPSWVVSQKANFAKCWFYGVLEFLYRVNEIMAHESNDEDYQDFMDDVEDDGIQENLDVKV